MICCLQLCQLLSAAVYGEAQGEAGQQGIPVGE